MLRKKLRRQQWAALGEMLAFLIIKMMHFVLHMMNYVFKTMNPALNMMKMLKMILHEQIWILQRR